MKRTAQKDRFRVWLSVVVVASVCAVGGAAEKSRIIPVDTVWSGHPVGFCLLTHGDRQYVAYYDAQRRMTVAARRLGEDQWEYVHLPSQLGWDSHNYVTMAFDDTGHIHLAGNMHAVPLVYFRTEQPYEIKTFKPIASMVGRDESHVTYPQFFRGADNELIFGYRDGGSGKGNQIYNVYDPAKEAWRRLMDTPFIDGEGEVSAYLDPFRRDGQGVFHLTWCWRETPDCATNRDVCYARSRDLVHWERSDGTPYTLPITRATAEVVDPVPPGGGLINVNVRLGFDVQDRPVISYVKYDAQGRTQAYNAGREDGRWRIRQVSDWATRWEFGGGGSIGVDVHLGAVQADGTGRLTQSYRHKAYGNGRWVLDPQTLTPKASATPPGTEKPVSGDRPEVKVPQPARASSTRDAAPGQSTSKPVEQPQAVLQARSADDSGVSPDAGVSYTLRWQTLGPNRDRPREGALPSASTLELVETRRHARPIK